MASIAYICQHEMIEFHRLRGHREIVFLRLSTRQFSKFDVNDYLFFLTRRPQRHERGVVGFGKLHKYEQLVPSSMWKKYQDMTGYSNQQEMNEALDSMRKTDSPIHKVGGLYLKDIIYFEYPIYLSEFGFELEPHLESFTYIDQEQDLTSQLFDSIKDVGLDLWSQTLSEPVSPMYLEIEIKRHILAETADRYGFLQDTRNSRIDNRLKERLPELEKLPSTTQTYTLNVNQTLYGYLPLLKKSQQAINEVIGISNVLYRVFEQHPLLDNPALMLNVYGSGPLKQQHQEQLELFNIHYLDVNEDPL